MEEFGLLLRKLRLKNNESLNSLSKKLNVSITFLSLLENNKKQIPLEYGDKLTTIFDLSEQESNELKSSIDYTNKKISIDLSQLSTERQEISLSFARTINTASQKKLEELRKILETNDEEV